MSVTPSALAHELSSAYVQSVAAIVYANEAYPDAIFKVLVSRCRALGLSLAGVLQHQAFEGADRRCDVLLEDLTSGHRTALFENRGPGARGCRLDEAALAEATARVEGSLENAPHLLVLNKFGKEIAEFRSLSVCPNETLTRGEVSRASLRSSCPMIPARSSGGWKA